MYYTHHYQTSLLLVHLVGSQKLQAHTKNLLQFFLTLTEPTTTLLFSTVSDTIVGLIITQFNYIHNKSLPVILVLCIQECWIVHTYIHATCIHTYIDVNTCTCTCQCIVHKLTIHGHVYVVVN